MKTFDDIIVAPATPPGVSALAVIRLSGPGCLELASTHFKNKDFSKASANTIHFGVFRENDRIIDEVLVSVFKAPHSFTKEDSVEISCHGSTFIVEEIIKVLIRSGARFAEPGEFTRRAFLHGQFDLAQAEAVADLIHSDSALAHKAAIDHMRGGFSDKIKELRALLVQFASLIELELDFGEEDVEFADRNRLLHLITELQQEITPLIASFNLGQVIKNGVPIVIAGKPNAGKSTLLNGFLKEEKAIVSDIAGTTRDIIEDTLQIEGINFRFIDTAGLRETGDQIEAIGVKKAYEQMGKASIILYLFDLSTENATELSQKEEELKLLGIPYLLLANKIDKADQEQINDFSNFNLYKLCAKDEGSIEKLKQELVRKIKLNEIKSGDTIVTNSRHYQSLTRTSDSLARILNGLNSGISGDMLAEDIRAALGSLGEITGEVTNDELLGNIFSKFCIGK